MNQIKKILIFLLVFAGVLSGLLYFINLPQKDTDYIVVSVSSRASDNLFPYKLINDKNTGVILNGKCPEYELSYVFLQQERNKFRIYGQKDEQMSDEYGCLVWNATDWEILVPIKRDYDKLDLESRERQRWFASPISFDSYDLEYQDYNPIEYSTFTMGYYEKQYWLSKEGYYLISPERAGNHVFWKRMDNDTFSDITICGNTPDNFFNTEIINSDESKKNMASIRNYFVVQGNIRGENTLFVEKWWLCVPFTRFETNGLHSKYGFTSADRTGGVIKGDIPK